MILRIAGTVLLVTGLGAMTSTAAFATPGNDDNVRICHRTNAVNNPYVSITVDPKAVDGIDNENGNQEDHYGRHQGPVFDKDFDYQPPMNGDEWGDIIPPLEGIHSGRNWNDAGIAIWNNGCNVPGPTNTPTPTNTVTQTATATETQTSTATATETQTQTATATQTETAVATETVTAPGATTTQYVPGPTVTVPGANVTETIYIEGPVTTETVTQPASTVTVTQSNNSTETVYVTEAPQEIKVTETATETVKVSETIYIDSEGQRTTAASTTTQAASPSTLPKTGGVNLAGLGIGAGAALAGATLLFLGRRKPRHN